MCKNKLDGRKCGRLLNLSEEDYEAELKKESQMAEEIYQRLRQAGEPINAHNVDNFIVQERKRASKIAKEI